MPCGGPCAACGAICVSARGVRLRQLKTGTSDFIAKSKRDAQQRLQRALRDAREAMNRKAERRLDDAQRGMQRTFRPVLANVMPYHRVAIAGGAAAVVVSLISMGWLALFDQATAVPSRELVRTVKAMSAEPADSDRGENRMLANIDLAPAATTAGRRCGAGADANRHSGADPSETQGRAGQGGTRRAAAYAPSLRAGIHRHAPRAIAAMSPPTCATAARPMPRSAAATAIR